MVYQLMAILASASWALGSLFSYLPSKNWGTINYNRTRILFTAAVLLIVQILMGLAFFPVGLSASAFFWILLSGLTGLFLGDGFLFLAMKHMGPRRTSLFFATNSPMVLILGILFFQESYSLLQILGIVLAFSGLVLVVAFPSKRGASSLEPNPKISWPVASYALLAALGQAIGILCMKQALLEHPTHAITVTFWRCLFAGLLFALYHFAQKRKNAWRTFFPSFRGKKNQRTYRYAAYNAILGLGIGASLVSFALIGGRSGMISTLSSLSPVFVLPLLWFSTKKRPEALAWGASLITIAGIALIFLS